MKFRNLFFVLLLFISSTSYAKYISPYNYGLNEATNGTEVYYVLLRTHESAIAQGCNVTYKGIKQIEIDIPSDARSIPLPRVVDFHGVKITVRNTKKSIFLFSLTQEIQKIDIDKQRIDDSYFGDFTEVNKGYSLLVIEDKLPWVEKRDGYNYGATRKDILLIHNGKKLNECVYSYNNTQSNPDVSYCSVSPKRKKYSNLYFERTADSKVITELFLFNNQYNIFLKNINVKTPESTLYGDRPFTFQNCAHIVLENIQIDGTYSAKDKYGYGISMDNVWDSKFIKIKSRCEWGVFGNYNVNYAVLKDCDINRFDIHFYGRDVYCYNTIFSNFYNQFSALYGDLVFEKCHFVNYIPVLFDPSFYAYTPFNLVIKDCVLDVNKKYPYLINAGSPASKHINPRNELSKVCWPNIDIDGLVVNIPDGVENWVLFGVNGNNLPEIEYISDLNIKKLVLKGSNPPGVIDLSNKHIRTKERLNIKITSSTIKEIIE